MATKYNVNYNGEIAFNEAKKQLDDTYEDNFWERLPIEPLKIEEEKIPMPGQTITESTEPKGFEKAEEKAVKAIQKHSMVFDGFEKNSQIDEAYFLLGKSRYYLQRFIPALEALSFALEKYPNSNLYLDTKIWKAKTHIRLQNEDLALETLKLVLRNIYLNDETFEKAHTTYAMAYTQLDSTELIIEHLKRSTSYFTDRSQGARNLFILGQIYREKNKIDSSNMVFENLAYMKNIPQKYKVHAILERAKNYQEKDSTNVIVYTLQELIENRDNRPYLDELFYQAGLIALKQENIEDANFYFESSVYYNKSKPFQKSLSFEKLGDLYFDKTLFETAGAYYDSVLEIPQDMNTKRIRQLIRKRESLKDVIYYETIANRNDSILDVSSMDPDSQEAFYQNYINELKIRDEEERKRIEIEQANRNVGLGQVSNTGSQQSASSGQFYFYNIQLIGFGKQEFKSKYGNRPLADNWIISGKSGPTIIAEKKDNSEPDTEDNLKYDVNFYISQIPTGENELDSIKKERNDAYYNLGLIYKEQFKEYELSAEKFEDFLKDDPSKNLILPTKYQLYKTYSNFDLELSNKYKNEIVSNYPDSRYAVIIQNPNSIVSTVKDEESPENIYKNAYICYEEGDFSYALIDVEKALQTFKGLEIESKYELLKAHILYKTKGKIAFIEKLNYIVDNFPNTEESKYSKAVIEKLQNETIIK